MAAYALVPYVSRILAAMVLNIQGKQKLVYNGAGS